MARSVQTMLRKRELDAVERWRGTIGLLGGLALIACAICAVIGAQMMFHRVHVQCTDGDGSVTACARHPHAGEGAVIVLFSAVLAVLVVAARIGVRLLLDARARELDA